MMNRKRSSRAFLVALALLLFSLGTLGCHTSDDSSEAGRDRASEVFDGIAIDQTMRFSGLAGRVEVIWDTWGVPHIYGIDGDEGDVMFVQGYVTAADRLWEMDIIRKFAEGKLTELLGLLMPFVLQQDVFSRTIFTTPRGNRVEDELVDYLADHAPNVLAQLQSYSDGVNAFLEDLKAGRNGAELPAEYRWLIFKPESIQPWTTQDCLAIGRFQQWDLSESMMREVRNFQKASALLNAESAGQIAEGTYRDTIRSAPIDDTYVLDDYYEGWAGRDGASGGRAGDGTPPVGRELLAGIDRVRLDQMVRAYEEIDRGQAFRGSNNWVIHGKNTESGYPLIANDPHLALYSPPIFYETHLDDITFRGGTSHFAGVNFPGIPGAIIGHSPRVAWAVTYVGYDVLDVYVEDVTSASDDPAAPKSVRFKGANVPVVRILEDFCIRGEAEPMRLPIEIVPHHGPQLPDPDPLDDVTGLASVNNMTMRWTGAEPTLEMIAVDALAKMGNMDDFFEALNTFDVGAQNFMAASLDGDIGYYPHAKIPMRDPRALTTEMPPWMPLPGTGEYEWLTNASGAVRFIPNDELPQARNPASGVIMTANNDQAGVTQDNDPLDDAHYLYWQPDYGSRATRIRELIDASIASGGGMSFQEMQAIQSDTVSISARHLLPRLLAALDVALAGDGGDRSDPRFAEVRWRLGDWDLTHPTGTDVTGYRLQPPTQGEIDTSVAATLYNTWVVRFVHRTFDDEYNRAGLGRLWLGDALRGVIHLFEDRDRPSANYRVHTLNPATGESRLFDDVTTSTVESSTDIILDAMIDALDFLESAFGTTHMGIWRWGSLHRISFHHTVFDQAGLSLFNIPSGPLEDGCLGNPAPGGYGTPNPGSYGGSNEDDFTFRNGPVVRFVVRMEPGRIVMESVLPGGQRGVYKVPAQIDTADHHADQTPLWLTNRYKPFPYYLEDVLEAAEGRWVFGRQR